MGLEEFVIFQLFKCMFNRFVFLTYNINGELKSEFLCKIQEYYSDKFKLRIG